MRGYDATCPHQPPSNNQASLTLANVFPKLFDSVSQRCIFANLGLTNLSHTQLLSRPALVGNAFYTTMYFPCTWHNIVNIYSKIHYITLLLKYYRPTLLILDKRSFR
jgi:hypothetical protein